MTAMLDAPIAPAAAAIQCALRHGALGPRVIERLTATLGGRDADPAPARSPLHPG